MVTPLIHTPLHTSRGTFIYSPLQDNFAKYFTNLIFTYETNRNQKGSKTVHRPRTLHKWQDWGFYSDFLHSKASASSDFHLREAPVEIQAV